METTYLEIQKDFEALTASRSAETIAGLDAAIADEAKGRPGVTIDPAEFADIWTKRGLLGPVTAKRLGARMPEAVAKATEEKGGATATTADALRHAVKLVFPEPTMADNWDKHFTDLDVVQRWAKAKGAAPPTPDPGKVPSAPDPADMVLVPKGELAVPDQRGRGWPQLGVKAEKRTVKAFYIDRTEVTGAAYAKFLRETKDARLRDRVLPKGWKLDDKGAPVMPDGAGSLPVSGVPYEGAAAFASSLGKRLPWEDEWERASRGNAGFKFPWGNDWADGNAVAGGKPGPAAAGTTTGDRSPFGLMDMAGNVSELCATYPDGKPVKGLPKDTDQVIIRGGNYKNPPDEASNDWRYVIGANTRSEWIGFRCAMDEKDYERRYGKK
jgi:formylglycine-generating enzyme required for sulfatase activity